MEWNRTAQASPSAQPHSSLRRKDRVMYHTDHAIRPIMIGAPVATLTTTKASTLLVSMNSRRPLLASRYTAHASETGVKARRNVSEAFTSGGNGYSSSAN